MLNRIYRTIENTNSFEGVIIFSKYPDLEIDGCAVSKDLSRGTLIHSIVGAIERFDEFLALGGDMPLVDNEVISNLMKEYSGTPVAAVDNNDTIEPLFAIYNRTIYDNMLEYSRHNRQIYSFIEKSFKLIRMNEVLSSKLFNVNTQKDLDKVRLVLECKDRTE